jgi:polyphosphate glucokinase
MEILGIDIGGSGIKGAPVNIETGELLAERFRIATPEPSKPQAVAEAVAELARNFEWQGPVGCGFPAAVRNGVSLTAANIHKKWLNANAAGLFSQATGCPVCVINDADAAGLAEMRFGAGRGRMGTVLIVTIGTGLGTALFTDGHLLPNTELGHIEIDGRDAELGASDAARKREDMSWERWAKAFDRYLNRLEGLFWPELFILGGGASKKHEKFLPLLTVQAEVVPAQLLNNAGIVGAALAAKNLFVST